MEHTVVSGTLHDGAVDFFHGNGEAWRRTGSCNRCGQCCLGCPHLVVRDGLYTCDDRTAANVAYSQGCVVFPNHPSHLAANPSCSYRFEALT